MNGSVRMFYQWSLIGVLTGFVIGSAYAQSEAPTARKREKYLEYNKSINWSTSPFDTAAHKEEMEKKGDEIPVEEAWSAPRMDNPFSDPQSFPDGAIGNAMSAVMREQQQFNQTGPRIQSDRDTEQKTLLDMDIIKEISGESEKETKESGWGWLADRVQTVHEKEPDGNEEQNRSGMENPEDTADRNKKENVTESLEVIRWERENKTATASGRSVAGIAAERSDKAGERTGSSAGPSVSEGGGAEQSAAAKSKAGRSAASDQLLSVWEREVGLAEAKDRNTGTLPQTRKILEELTRSAIRPTEASTGEGPASRSTVSSTVNQPISLISQRQSLESGKAASGGLSSPGWAPYQSGYSQGISSFERGRSTAFSRESYTPTYASGFDQTSAGKDGAVYNDSFQTQASSPSSLETFRQIHRSSGTIRPFESDSDPWK